MTPSLDKLRRQAKTLKREHGSGSAEARTRVANIMPKQSGDLKHADALHVIAREAGFPSWPVLKLSAELIGLDKAAKRQRLKHALYQGQNSVIETLLGETPDLAKGDLGLEIALYDFEAVRAAIWSDPKLASKAIGPSTPLLRLAQSKAIHLWPERVSQMLAIADVLHENGADLDQGMPVNEGSEEMLSPLYFAIGHANNMALGEWLLKHGANPNDNESLYHSTELGHHVGLKLLLEHGADPEGTNALLRAMDFHDHEAVRLLLDHGAKADEYDGRWIGGEPPWVIPTLHQAARRMSDRAMVEMLLEAGADPSQLHDGCSAYGYARVFGNGDLAQSLETRGLATDLTPEESLLAAAADGEVPEGIWIDPAKLPMSYREILAEIFALPGRQDHIERLIALGIEYDRPNREGLTPVQLAGWQGQTEAMAYFLKLSPDLSHINGYGGTLLSTIIHGSENCPERANRDHAGCLHLALHEGVAIPRRALRYLGDDGLGPQLTDWAERYPGQVVEGGVF